MSGTPDITQFLPPSLNLPPHLSAHKYFFVCTLTVAAWDTLVLSPRTWRLFKTNEWPPLKILFHVLRLLMPVEFIIVAVAFFDTKFTASMCQSFYLFEPIVTAVLITLCSIVHAIRIYAIYDKNMTLLGSLGVYLLFQVAVMAVSTAFYRPMPLLVGQGCIAGPRHDWVGIYWAAPTVFFITTFGFALSRSIQSLSVKPLGYWKLMLRDGLNLYGAIMIVNVVNTIFYFAARPTDDKDTIKTIVTSMAAVLTTTMTLRIILSVRGSLAQGGAYAGVSTTGSGSRGTTHVISTRGNASQPGVVNIGVASQQLSRSGAQPNPSYTLEEMRAKAERDWIESSDGRSSVNEGKEGVLGDRDLDKSADTLSGGGGRIIGGGGGGVKVTIDREVDYPRGYKQ